MTASDAVRLATWNIRGGHHSHDIARIIAVLREIDADVVAVQEVMPLRMDDGLLQAARDELGMEGITGRTLTRRDIDYGNALLSRLPVRTSASIDLTIERREPRNAIDAHIALAGKDLHVVATHLGLRPRERREQVRRILRALDHVPLGPAVVMGDLNEWYLWGRPLRWLHRRFAAIRTPPTFPARRPMLKLDRIWAHPASALVRLAAHRSALARDASDHLPLVADFRF